MTITLKTPEDIEKMRIAGRLAAEVLEMIAPHVKPGAPPKNWTASAMTTSSTSSRRSRLR